MLTRDQVQDLLNNAEFALNSDSETKGATLLLLRDVLREALRVEEQRAAVVEPEPGDCEDCSEPLSNGEGRWCPECEAGLVESMEGER